MNDLTVVHLITRFLDGGAEKTTKNTLEALREDNQEYELHLGTGVEYYSEELADLEEAGIETTVFRSLRHYNPAGALMAIGAVTRYLCHHDVDLLHTHSTEAGIVGRWAGFFAKTPVVIHEIHGDPIADDHHPLLNAFIYATERASAPVTNRFIVKSERIRDEFLSRGIGTHNQYELIYHGVNLEQFQREKSCRTSDDQMELLFVGRLAEGKGLWDLLDAVDRLEDIRLRIAGKGPLLEDLDVAISRRSLPVELLGYRDDIPELLASSDVFVLPSLREGTPRAITEALAAGCPVVSTHIAGIPDQVDDGKTGYLVEPGDVDMLVSRLQSLRDPDRRRRFGERARESVKQFSVDTAKQRYEELYRELLDGH